jgi:hypothetical protein
MFFVSDDKPSVIIQMEMVYATLCARLMSGPEAKALSFSVAVVRREQPGGR